MNQFYKININVNYYTERTVINTDQLEEIIKIIECYYNKDVKRETTNQHKVYIYGYLTKYTSDRKLENPTIFINTLNNEIELTLINKKYAK